MTGSCWLTITMAVHNDWTNTTLGMSPNEALLGYRPLIYPNQVIGTNNEAAEARINVMLRKRYQSNCCHQSGLEPLGTDGQSVQRMSRTSTFCRTDYVRGIQLPDSDCLCFEGFNPLYGIWFSGSQYGTSISRLYAYKGCSIDD